MEDKSFNLCTQFFNYRRDENDDLATHLSKLKNLWNQLKGEVKMSDTCDCRLPDVFLICKILETLPPEYFGFKSSWVMLSKTDRTIENLTTQLCAHERTLNLKVESKTDILAVKQYENKKKSQSKVICDYCEKPNHHINICRYWLADGKPPHPVKWKGIKLQTPKSGTTGTSNVTKMLLNTESSEFFFSDGESDFLYVDSGATKHVTHRKDWFMSFEKFDNAHFVRTANGNAIPAVGKGNVVIESNTNGVKRKLTLCEVWYVPEIVKNLFSTLVVQDKLPDSKFVTSTEKCELIVGNETVLRGSRIRNGGLYKLDVKICPPENSLNICSVDRSNSLQLYHERLAHQNVRHVAKIVKAELGIELKAEWRSGSVLGP